MIRVFACSAAGQLTESQGPEAFRQAWREKPARLWADFEDATGEELTLLTGTCGFHPSAVGNVIEHSGTPSFTAHDTHAFLFLHRVFYHFEKETCELRDFAVFFDESVIVTIHRSHLARTFAAVADKVRDDPKRELGQSTGPVLQHLLEGVINDYRPVLEQWQEAIEDVEQLVLEGSKQDILPKILGFKKLATALRKNLYPQKVILAQLHERARHAHLSDAMRPYFKGVADEMSTLLREIESLSSHAASAFEVYAAVLNLEMTRSSHNLSFVMQRLNVMMSIFMPLTFIVGVYGMNVPDMPELKWKGFYFLLWGVMSILTIVMLFLFKRMKWY